MPQSASRHTFLIDDSWPRGQASNSRASHISTFQVRVPLSLWQACAGLVCEKAVTSRRCDPSTRTDVCLHSCYLQIKYIENVTIALTL